MSYHAIPDVDRLWHLIENAYDDGLTVLGWADSMITHAAMDRPDRLTFDVTPAPDGSHEGAVLVVAVRVPHPDEMSLAEMIMGCPCCDIDGTHRHDDDCMHPCCRDGDESPEGSETQGVEG